jgi:hypothetical protein
MQTRQENTRRHCNAGRIDGEFESCVSLLIFSSDSTHFNRGLIWPNSSWIEQTLEGSYLQQISEMLDRYGEMGLVEARRGLNGDPDIPAVLYVSDGAKVAATSSTARLMLKEESRERVEPSEFSERLGNFPFKSPDR